MYTSQGELWGAFLFYVGNFYNFFRFEGQCSSSCQETISKNNFSRSLYYRPVVCVEKIIFTARKRSLRRLCFHRCLSVHMGVLGLDGGSPSGGGVSLSRGSPSVGVSVRETPSPERPPCTVTSGR